MPRQASRLRRISLAFIAPLPGFLKRPLLRCLFGYRIGRGVRIGVAYLDCARLTIGDGARISHGVVFTRCGEVTIGEQARIGPLNLFRGGARVELGPYSQVIRLNVINAIPEHDCTNATDSSFFLGFGSVVTAEHRIDFTDRVRIGKCSIFGGRNSSIWTHNRRIGKPVEIGEFCYLASEIRMAPGAAIADCCIAALGSVVSHPLTESHCLVGGVPAKKLRALTPEDRDLLFAKTRPEIPDSLYPVPPSPLG